MSLNLFLCFASSFSRWAVKLPVFHVVVLAFILFLPSLPAQTLQDQELLRRVASGEAPREDIDQAIERLRQGWVGPLWPWLGQYGEMAGEAIPVLEELLEDDVAIRGAAASALGEFGPLARSAVPRLVALVARGDSESPRVIAALGKIQDKSAIPILLDVLEGGLPNSSYAAAALARFPDSILQEYVAVERSVTADIVTVVRSQISTREDFDLMIRVRLRGNLTLDGVNYGVDFPNYFLERQDIVYVIETPSGERFRLNILPDPSGHTADARLGWAFSVSINANGLSLEARSAQNGIPEFKEEGVYTIYLEGTFLDRTGLGEPLGFSTSTTSFEISSKFLSRAEEKEKANEEIRREFPAGSVLVMGNVRHPRRIVLEEGMRFSDAIARAGGLTRSASPRGFLARDGFDRQEINFRALAQGEVEDSLLQDLDVIHVPVHCIVAGEQVMTPDGPVAVELLHQGDYVLAYDPVVGKFSHSRIVSISSSTVAGYIWIDGRLKVTPSHVLYADGDWREAGEVTSGMALLDIRENAVIVREVIYIPEEVDVYELSVESPHTYFVNEILVHNKI